MIKEAIEKIEAMAKPQVLEIGDHTFAVLSNGNYKEIHEDVYGAKTLELLSQITTGAKITYNDIGVATTIVTQKGVSLQANATIRPLVRLRPYRTSQEIEQPLGLFLIRIDERGISFVEADGGMWKLEARKTIKEYLEEHLADEIEAGRVTVML